MIDLSNVVAVSVDGDGSRYERLHTVITSLRNHIRFHDIKVFSKDKRYSNICTRIDQKCKSIRDYNYICLFLMSNFVDADYCMIFHDDGFPLIPGNWDNAFLSVDYIGAPWEVTRGHSWANEHRVGNGGFSLRSKRLLDLVQAAVKKMGRRTIRPNEDGVICLRLRSYLEKHGCRFADYELARRFSIETLLDNEDLTVVLQAFGFHDHNNTLFGMFEESFGSVFKVPNSIFD